MKTRNGFVSNSSSSSFVIICKEEDHKKAIKKLHPYYKAWIEQKLIGKIQDFAGVKVIVSSIHISTEDEEPINYKGKLPPEAEDYGFEDDDGKSIKMVPGGEIIPVYVEELKKISNDVIFIEGNF